MAWRDRLRPASFRGVPFHVEMDSQSGGRRVALHEFPKRSQPWSEDMGRKARRFRVSAYLIGPNYDRERAALEAALDADGPGLLVLPLKGEHLVMVEDFSSTESREQGGFAVIEMSYVEEGSMANFNVRLDASQIAVGLANAAIDAVVGSLARKLGGSP